MGQLYYSYIIAICLNLLLLFQNINGGLAKGILGTINQTAQKIHDDNHTVFQPKEEDKGGLYPEVNNIKYKETEDSVLTFVSTTRMPQVMPNSAPTKAAMVPEDRPFIFAISSTPGTDTVQATTTKRTFEYNYNMGYEYSNWDHLIVYSYGNSNNIDFIIDSESSGWNFDGDCWPGTDRTPDGRCMPAARH